MGPPWPDRVLWAPCVLSRTTAGRGRGWRRAPGALPQPSWGDSGGKAAEGGRGLSRGSISGSQRLCGLGSRSWGLGGDWHGYRAESGKDLENKREKRETPPNTQGLKPPKAQGWWESSTRGPPEGQESSVGPWGRGEEPGEGLPALAGQHSCRAASRLPSLAFGCSSAGPGEVLVASKHLNIA